MRERQTAKCEWQKGNNQIPTPISYSYDVDDVRCTNDLFVGEYESARAAIEFHAEAYILKFWMQKRRRWKEGGWRRRWQFSDLPTSIGH